MTCAFFIVRCTTSYGIPGTLAQCREYNILDMFKVKRINRIFLHEKNEPNKICKNETIDKKVSFHTTKHTCRNGSVKNGHRFTIWFTGFGVHYISTTSTTSTGNSNEKTNNGKYLSKRILDFNIFTLLFFIICRRNCQNNLDEERRISNSFQC
jgi:hypothetical protein